MQLRTRIAIGAAAGTALVAAMLPAAPVGAAPTQNGFVGYAGATMIKALNVVTSDLTGESTVYGGSPLADQNDTADVAIQDVVHVGAVHTRAAIEKVAGGLRLTTVSRTADVEALGVLTAKAIETTTTTSLINGKATTSAATTFVGLNIVGVKLPVTVPKNFGVRIPGLATLYLNYQASNIKGDTAVAYGVGAFISLLKPIGGNGVGAQVSLNPTYASTGPVPPPAPTRLSGKAYGTYVNAQVGDKIRVRSDATVPSSIPAGGTNGETRKRSVASVDILTAVRVGAIETTARGVNTTTAYDGETTAKVAKVSLLGGAIKADAITATARVQGVPGAPTATVSGGAGLVNLTIGGQKIPVNAAPNTTVKIANLAVVTVNQQIRKGKSITVRALDVTLTTAAYGLPVGAEIQVAVASAAAQ